MEAVSARCGEGSEGECTGQTPGPEGTGTCFMVIYVEAYVCARRQVQQHESQCAKRECCRQA